MISLALHPHELAALAEGRLSQIRRPVDLPAWADGRQPDDARGIGSGPRFWEFRWRASPDFLKYGTDDQPCPLGAPGDHLRVLEEWWSRDEDGCHYRADCDGRNWWERVNDRCLNSPIRFTDDVLEWQPADTLPEWASRYFLENVGVRVGRLDDATEADAAAEGYEPGFLDGGNYEPSDDPDALFLPSLAHNWDALYPEHLVESNCWTWIATVKETTR